METIDNSQLEIDVLQLLKKLWNRKFLIIFVSLIFGGVAQGVSVFLMKPSYTSTTRIYVVNQKDQAQGISTQDLQAGDYLVKDYQEIIRSTDVMQTVVAEKGLTITPSALASKVRVSTPTGTRIISISVEDQDPIEASNLTNAVREVAAEKIKTITKVEDVTTLEEAEPPTAPSSPNIRRNVSLGVLTGGFLAVAFVLISELLNDRVTRPEDIEEVLGMTLLGVVPEMD
ncbi:Wzz/FepE/Etk N-terminal domain-containing protein [Streptococcus merionis]|uniref:Capsular polysaccharide biosynthesis protein CpsC n=1 Tax=Streptococcus merionis TaxID=400065 RepID=A0A239SS33_9STRE|nr:Wzz/FepE/Etk N-terminal domain-containing protein [Streptococcus merionis]SNU88291.1 chain length determinant protein [Streptococcus merionis]